MSNNVMNLLNFEADSADELLELVNYVTNDEGFFSLNEIAPVPDDFADMTTYPLAVSCAKRQLESELGVDLFSDFERLLAEHTFKSGLHEGVSGEDVKRVKALYKKHGYCCFSDWARANWGTGSDVLDEQGFEEDGFCFISSNSTILPALVTVSKKFPNVKMTLEFADEDYGDNCGSVTVKNGRVLRSEIAPSWKEQSKSQQRRWMKFACQVWNCHDYYDEWLETTDE